MSAFAADTWTPSSNVAQTPASTFLMEEGTRPACAVLSCENQLKFWKRSARPVFDGQWACSRICARKLVEAAIRKQIGGASLAAAALGSHRHRIPLGLVLLDRGIVTQFQLRQALDAQRGAGHGRVGYWLEQTCGISAEKITLALAAQWNRPALSASAFNPERMGVVMPAALRKEFRLLPLRVAAEKMLYAAFVDEIDATAIRALERMTGLAVESGLLPHDQFAAAEAQLDFVHAPACKEETIADSVELTDRVVDALFDHQPVASRLISVRSGWWLRLWLERAACSVVGTLPSTGEDVVDILFRR